MVDTFIRRPILASVCSLVLILAGAWQLVAEAAVVPQPFGLRDPLQALELSFGAVDVGDVGALVREQVLRLVGVLRGLHHLAARVELRLSLARFAQP